MTKLPFMNDSAIRDTAQSRAKTYQTSFTAKKRACIQRGKAFTTAIKRTMTITQSSAASSSSSSLRRRRASFSRISARMTYQAQCRSLLQPLIDLR
ncbi:MULTISPECIES: hypothetical protein [unclassified Bradyrhizobium]|nr:MULTISPECIES: hypothetical protein [unclassified Bradyrhizobium]